MISGAKGAHKQEEEKVRKRLATCMLGRVEGILGELSAAISGFMQVPS